MRIVAILVVLVLVGVVGYFQFLAPKDKPTAEQDWNAPKPPAEMTLAEFDLPGSEPPEPVVLTVEHEVDTEGGKHRIWATITEEHGYFVETFRLEFYHVGTPDHRFDFFADKYLPAGGKLKLDILVSAAELDLAGGEMGNTEDWAVEIVQYGRARAETPKNWPEGRPDNTGGE